MPTTRESNVFAIEVQEFGWQAIPEQILCVGESLILDLNAYLPEGVDATIAWKAGSGNLPTGVTLQAGFLYGRPTETLDDVWTLPIFIATLGTISVESQEVRMAVLNEGDWTPTITGLEATETVDMATGSYVQIGNRVNFHAKFRAQNTAIWTNMAPKLSLPVATTTPTDILGTATGYGGSIQKFLGTKIGIEEAFDIDIYPTNPTLFVFPQSAAIHDGTIYIGTTFDAIFTFDISDNTFTNYRALNQSQAYNANTWVGLASQGNTLFGILSQTSPSRRRFYSINSATSRTLIANLQQTNLTGFASLNNQLYVLQSSTSTSQQRIYTLNSSGVLGNAVSFTNISTAEAGALGTLFVHDGSLTTLSRNSNTLYQIDVSSTPYAFTAIGAFEETPTSHAGFSHNEYLYFAGRNATSRYKTDAVFDQLSISFEGDDYTTAIGHCILSDDDLIQVELEKLQRNEGNALIQISGSYQT